MLVCIRCICRLDYELENTSTFINTNVYAYVHIHMYTYIHT